MQIIIILLFTSISIRWPAIVVANFPTDRRRIPFLCLYAREHLCTHSVCVRISRICMSKINCSNYRKLSGCIMPHTISDDICPACILCISRFQSIICTNRSLWNRKLIIHPPAQYILIKVKLYRKRKSVGSEENKQSILSTLNHDIVC